MSVPMLVRIALVAALGATTAACSDDDDTHPDATDAADADADGDGDADADADVGPRETCGVQPADPCLSCVCTTGTCEGACVGGTVRDPAGAALFDQPAVVCTGDRCYFGRSDEVGFWSVSLPSPIAGSFAVYYPGESPRHTPYCRYEATCSGTIHVCTDVRLYPAPTSGTEVPAGELAADLRLEAANGAAVTFPAGVEVLLPIDAGTWAALSRFPLEEHVPCFIDPGSLPLVLYVMTPLEAYAIEPGTMVDPVFVSADLDLPNDLGLAADETVDIWVVGGGHATDVDMAEGEWRRWTSATVSADGARIRTAPGEGVGYLTWFGVYRP
jgi:hypothetical protein